MKAIKIVKREGEKLVSAFIGAGWILDPREKQAVRDATVEYTPGEWATPKVNAGPLCAWRPSMKEWLLTSIQNLEIWECKVKPWNKQLPKELSDTLAVWIPRDVYSRFYLPTRDLPCGTLLCEAIKLTRRIK